MIRSLTTGPSTRAKVLDTRRALAIGGFVAALTLGGAYTLGYLRPARASIVPSQGSSTNLLFTFLFDNDEGGDVTDLAISNTSSDPFGTTPQSGACNLYFYGTAAPTNPVVTPTITAGTTYLVSANALAPGFQGYMIATCNFRYAHGVALGLAPNGSSFFSIPAVVISMVPRPNNENLNE